MRRPAPILSLALTLILLGCASKEQKIAGAPMVTEKGPQSLAPGELPGDKNIQNPEVAYNMALEFAGQGNMEAARHYIDLASRLRQDSKYSFTKGLFSLSEQKYSEALLYLEQAMKLGPGTMENRLAVLNAEGVCLKELGRDDEALERFREVVNTPGLFSRYESYYNMGVIYMRQKKFLDAQAVFMKVAQENPGYYRAYNKLGILAATKEDWAGAAVYFKKALDLIANNYDATQADGAEINLNYGEALFREKLYPEARNALMQVLRISPESTYGTRAKELLGQIGG